MTYFFLSLNFFDQLFFFSDTLFNILQEWVLILFKFKSFFMYDACFFLKLVELLSNLLILSNVLIEILS